MALLDRFRTQARHKHPDAAIRLAYIDEIPIDERDLIAEIATDDEDARVRRAAVGKLLDPAALGAVARADVDESVRAQAVAMLRDIALESFEGLGEAESAAAVGVLDDARALAHVAKYAAREAVALDALARITDVHADGSIARHAGLEAVRRAAFLRLSDHDEILDVALHSEFKDTALAAVERLSDRAELEQVAARAKNKSAGKRARGLLREQDERAAAEAAAAPPPPPDPASLADAERLHLVQKLDVATSAGDPEAARAVLAGVQTAWSAIDGQADQPVAARFAAAVDALLARIADAEAQAERAREVAEAARLRAEADARSRAAAAAVAAEDARQLAEKDAERRRLRLVELAADAESAAADLDLASARRRLALVAREWKDLAAGLDVAADLASRVAAADARVAARDAEAAEQDARARREALHRLNQLLGRVEPLVAHAEISLKAADRALRDIRAALGDVPPLPSKRDFDEVVQRLKAAQASLAPKVTELREAEDWKRFANLAVQEQLCARMEALKALEDPEAIAREIHDLQEQWRKSADVPRGQADALWRRFKSAHDELWPRCEAYFAAQAEQRAANLAAKVALCAKVEAVADSTNWIPVADEIKKLQAEWKTIGPVTRGQEKAVWERFRSACDRFFTRRQADLAARKAVWSENFAKKEALSVRAEALADSTDGEAAAAEIRRLQAEWKTVGPVKKSRSEAIWLRFRGACDRFFSRYAQRHDVARAERVAAREAICAELEALAPSAGDEAAAAAGPAEPPADLLATVHAARGRWQREIAARGVDRERAQALDLRFAAAFDRLLTAWPAAFAGTDLDPDANRKRMETLVRRIEDLAGSLGRASASADEAMSPTTRLAAMLKEALAANTIGGKVDEDSRWRAAAEEVRQAQAAWSRIGLVPDAIRRALADRFQRACKKIMERQEGRKAERQ